MSSLRYDTTLDTHYASPPRSAVTAPSFSDGEYSLTLNGKKVNFKGAEYQLASDGTDPDPATGYLKVHLVEDAATTYYLMQLTAGERPKLAVFDRIIESGTTVAMANIVVFPE